MILNAAIAFFLNRMMTWTDWIFTSQNWNFRISSKALLCIFKNSSFENTWCTCGCFDSYLIFQIFSFYSFGSNVSAELFYLLGFQLILIINRNLEICSFFYFSFVHMTGGNSFLFQKPPTDFIINIFKWFYRKIKFLIFLKIKLSNL